MTLRCGLALALVLAASAAVRGQRMELAWPTPNHAWAEGKPSADFLQQAGSGDPASGGFGGVRSSGAQFHEGLDLKCIARDRRGEPTDEVYAAMDGIVRYVNSSPGDSSYGRYIVLEHVDVAPAIYTLYGHLARMAPGLRVGQHVSRGQVIATMGHSSGGYSIPKDRAHLHFEVGLLVTRDFEAWYERRKFGSRNDHGIWNGMNLMGIDPLEFFNDWRARRIDTPRDFFARQATAVRVRIATHRTPDFVARYPSLLTKPLPAGLVAGWEIRCNWTGLPCGWTPLESAETIGLAPDEPLIVEANAELLRRERSKSIAVPHRGGGWTPGKDLEIVLQQLLGVK